MSRLPIAVAQGDGIGPEIMRSVIKIFDAAKVPLSYTYVDMGRKLYEKGFRTGMTPEAQQTVESLGILFKGPMETPKGTGVKSINVTARKVWNTFANKRRFESIAGGVDTVFSRAGIPIDLTLIRENIEDTYGGIEHMQTRDVAQCRRLITRPGCYQVHRYAFKSAQAKSSKKVTCAHKANIMKLTDGMFLETFYEVAKEFPDVKANDVIVDDLAMKLVMHPQQFDTIVLPNLQGDIISDMCAGLIGGLGLAPSANIGERISIFEAVHGTAPDITGKNMANPTALLLSGLMMLRHLNLQQHSDAIHNALVDTLKAGERTVDLAPKDKKPLSTDDFTKAVISRIPSTESFFQHDKPFDFNHTAPIKPSEHVLHATPATLPQIHTGIDVFVDSDLKPNALATKLQSLVPEGMALVMLSNRGTQVWPTSSLFTECVNHYRARLEISQGYPTKSSEELLDVAKQVATGVRVCSVEMLMKIGDKVGYTLAQGQ